MGIRRAVSFKVVLLSQSFKFCDISEINENILFLVSLVNARKTSLSAIRVRNTHTRVCVVIVSNARIKGKLSKKLVIVYGSSLTAVQYCYKDDHPKTGKSVQLY